MCQCCFGIHLSVPVFFSIVAITPAFVPGTSPEPLLRAFPSQSRGHPLTEEIKLRHQPTSLIYSKLQQRSIREVSYCYFGQESAHFRLLIWHYAKVPQRDFSALRNFSSACESTTGQYFGVLHQQKNKISAVCFVFLVLFFYLLVDVILLAAAERAEISESAGCRFFSLWKSKHLQLMPVFRALCATNLLCRRQFTH